MSGLARVAYSDGSIPLVGQLVRPAATPRAAIAVFPTFMNSTPGVEAKALALAEQGYCAFIADFYGPDTPHDFASANEAMMRLRADPHIMRNRLRATIDKLRELEPGVPLVAIGFCLGGMSVLELARDSQDLLLVASFHGLLQTPLPATSSIKPRLLVFHGDADFLVPRDHVLAFWDEMDAVGADWHFHSYAGVDHGFTNPLALDGSANPAYNTSADRQSWSAMLSMLEELLPSTGIR